MPLARPKAGLEARRARRGRFFSLCALWLERSRREVNNLAVKIPHEYGVNILNCVLKKSRLLHVIFKQKSIAIF
jgi:hypothetical protein